jgi:hypothetical protein
VSALIAITVMACAAPLSFTIHMIALVRLVSTLAIAWAMGMSLLTAQDAPMHTLGEAPFITLKLFGGASHQEYLGCLNCGELTRDSVCNPRGPYGDDLNAISIWNPLGTYGDRLRRQSPWNALGDDPPVILDQNGKFYGYFTKNHLAPKRTTIRMLAALLDRVGYDLSLEEGRDFFCRLD